MKLETAVRSPEILEPPCPTIVVATTDSEIRAGLAELFRFLPVNAIWLKGVEAAKNILAKERIAACFCGFWLQDGTYRELVRYIKRERSETPVIIVSPPSCSSEFSDNLSAINMEALNFLRHPYLHSDLQRILPLAASWLEPAIPASPTARVVLAARGAAA